MSKELDHPKKGLINIQDPDDYECFKWCCLVRYLHPAYHNLRISRKVNRLYGNKLDFKDIKIPVKVRDVHKIDRKSATGISVFGYEDKEKYPIYMSKKFREDKHVNLLFIDEGQKKHDVHIKDFNTVMYDHTLYHGRKNFCRYCLQAFRTADALKCHIKDYFKINFKQRIKMPRKGEYVRFESYERKIKSPFMIYAVLKVL